MKPIAEVDLQRIRERHERDQRISRRYLKVPSKPELDRGQLLQQLAYLREQEIGRPNLIQMAHDCATWAMREQLGEAEARAATLEARVRQLQGELTVLQCTLAGWTTGLDDDDDDDAPSAAPEPLPQPEPQGGGRVGVGQEGGSDE